MSCLGCVAVVGAVASISGRVSQGRTASVNSDLCGCFCSSCILILLLVSGAMGFFTQVFESECFTPWARDMMKKTEDLTWKVTFSSIQLLICLAFKTFMNLFIIPKIWKELGQAGFKNGLGGIFQNCR